MNNVKLIVRDRIHHITFNPHNTIVDIQYLLTLDYISSMVGHIMYKQRIVINDPERNGSNSLVKM